MKDTLRDLRELVGKTAAEIANELGVARSTYSNYEQGTRTLPLNLIVPLSRILCVSAEEVVEAQLESIRVRSSD